MPLTLHAFTAAEIRAAEQPLLDEQAFDDELMRSAAHGVAEVARIMLQHRAPERPECSERPDRPHRILVLAGSGGNGGDALYAAAELLEQEYRGHQADALELGREGKVHPRARSAFSRAAGQFIEELRPGGADHYDLIIDGILGLGGAGGLSEEVAEKLRALPYLDAPILSVDVPSGIGADSGVTPAPWGQGPARKFPAHIHADVTVTFGGLRYAHGLSAQCGEVVVVEAATHAGRLSEHLLRQAGANGLAGVHQVHDGSIYPWPGHMLAVGSAHLPDLEPTADDDKYSGGVVGVAAGSGTYPGAAILSTLGAVRTTSSMVRYAGPQAVEVVRALPEVVATETHGAAGRVQAWVYGPGSGTDSADDLLDLLATELPVLIDADGLTLVAGHASLRERIRTRSAATVLTPHAGEFQRLAEATGITFSEETRVESARALAGNLDAAILLKGRGTVVAVPSRSGATVTIIETGSSWAATPGSGDVLSGITGALMAWWASGPDNPRSPAGAGQTPAGEKDDGYRIEYRALPQAVAIQAMAARIAAQTPDGAAPTSASRIGEAIPRAIARLRRHLPQNHRFPR